MAENVYLRSRREEFEGLQKAIKGLQAKAAEEKRELTNEELRSITEMGERAETLRSQIDLLYENELRTASVQSMADRLTQAQKVEDNSESVRSGGTGDGTGYERVGGARTQDRDPGTYRLGGENSYVADQYRSKVMGDTKAAERLTQYAHAMKDNEQLRDVIGTTGGSGVGLVPPVWLAEQFAPILHRRLRVADRLRRVPWAGPYPWTIPVAGTAGAMTLNTQSDGTPPSTGLSVTETDPTYTTVVITPYTISGYAEVSRQLLEGSNPAVDSVIFGDLLGAFYDQAETNVVSAIEATANINLATASDGTVANMRSGVLDAIGFVEDNAGGDADLFFSRRARWHQYLKLVDTAGRPIVVNQRYGPMNAAGLGTGVQGFRNALVGELEALDVVTTPTVTSNRAYVVNSQELLFSISNPMQFSFEQPAGPALIRVGVWGYMAVVPNRRPKAISRLTFTSLA